MIPATAAPRQRATVTYTQVQHELGIDRPYGAITRFSTRAPRFRWRRTGVVLPVLVVNKESGVPGDKFASDQTNPTVARTGFWKFCRTTGST